jgi:hypothetical protein
MSRARKERPLTSVVTRADGSVRKVAGVTN